MATQSKTSASETKGVATGVFTLPVAKKDIQRVSSSFQPNGRLDPTGSGRTKPHWGLDIAAANGTPQLAADGGTVTWAKAAGTAGNMVTIDHGNGIVTRYMHMGKIDVKQGEKVAKGQRIGTVGNTGSSTGPHVHWEVLKGKTLGTQNPGGFGLATKKTAINPEPFVKNGDYSKYTSQSTKSTDKVSPTSVESQHTNTNEEHQHVDNTYQSQDSGNGQVSRSTDVSTVVTLLKNNATEVKNQYGLDVTTEEGLGKAVMQYWKENNLDPKTLKEQLPTLKESGKASSLENQDGTKSNTELSKVVALLKDNATEVKSQYGLDVTTEEGLGKAVMQYWKENNLDPKTLKEQLPNMKDSELSKASATLNTNGTEAKNTKQLSLQH
jgi:Peptidase family M23